MLGERWSLLIIREIFSGRHRFTEIQSALGVASNLLTTRLKKLVDAGVLRYHLTPAGEELLIVLAALPVGGERHSHVHPDPPSYAANARPASPCTLASSPTPMVMRTPLADLDMVSIQRG
ncbi:winged helix-turn-helix transcriptional regulator [Streptomyces mirabilis]|uniref:winged helix-turn-helix transcriptional regulator n=1 Tax=Streptomyces mirabilis TaxID=68239 RepID=UPI0036CB359A